MSILDPARVAEILDVPQDWSFIGHLCIGYPEEEADLPALQHTGAARAYALLKAAGLTLPLKVLYTLEAAIRGVHWSALDKDDQQALRTQLAALPPQRANGDVRRQRTVALVFISGVNDATIRAVNYARTLRATETRAV